MEQQGKAGPGQIGWIDLTVDAADDLRDFYLSVVGWQSKSIDMGGYDDYVMADAETGEGRAGVCHRRTVNAGQPGGWIVYFTVADLQASMARCRELGGEILAEREQFAVIRDPTGAVCALYQT